MATAYNPKLVTSGLILYLDAGNQASYPGSGTTWNDLSGNSRNASLVNGPTFSSDALGSVVFDGVNDYGTASGISTAGSMAISCWFKTSTQQTNKYLVCFSNNISLGSNGFDVSLQGTQVGSYARASATAVVASSPQTTTMGGGTTSVQPTMAQHTEFTTMVFKLHPLRSRVVSPSRQQTRWESDAFLDQQDTRTAASLKLPCTIGPSQQGRSLLILAR